MKNTVTKNLNAKGATTRLVPLVDGTKAAKARLAKLDARGDGPAGVEVAVRRILDAVRKDLAKWRQVVVKAKLQAD